MMIAGTVRLAAVIYQAGLQGDEVLAHAVKFLRSDRVITGGVLQENGRGPAGSCTAMSLVDIRSQRRFSISQELGSQAQGCRLDASGLSEVAVMLDQTLDHDIELLVLNRFGKAEAEGGGLRTVFARAMESGIPLLTAVRSPHAAAWSEFHGGLAIDLTPELNPVLNWCRESVRELKMLRCTRLSSSVQP
ncbi:MAG: DUF2478 domain-containing protein [Pseudolabrys sp.]|nr:DUF2478 domain-containing protein [Pseudolabrys sp.]